MKENPARKAYLFAFLAVLFWSTSPTAFKLGLRQQDIVQLLSGATITSFIVLGTILLAGKRYMKFREFGWKDLGFSALMGLLNPVAYYLVLFRAYSILPAQVAQPLNMVWPLVLVLISIPMLHQKIGWKSIGAMVLSFSGVVLISMQEGAPEKHPDNVSGIILALSTSLIWAFYWIFNARDGKDPLVRMFLNFLCATVFLVAAGLLKGNGFPSSLTGWGTAAYVGVFEMGVTFVLWLLAMHYAPATDRISNLVYMAPFLNLVFVNLVLGERIYLTTIPGIILLVLGILVQKLIERNAAKNG
jgi:drug/metabolite transporter (DMT)-like permease